MGRCCRALGKECNIRKLGLRYHDSRAFTDAPVSVVLTDSLVSLAIRHADK